MLFAVMVSTVKGFSPMWNNQLTNKDNKIKKIEIYKDKKYSHQCGIVRLQTTSWLLQSFTGEHQFTHNNIARCQ